MWLIVGLGNPETRYSRDRHNVGFRVVDRFSEKYNIQCKTQQANSLVGKGLIRQESILLLKPQTFMNLSGEAVGLISRSYRILPQNIIVIHDDLNLDFARLLLKKGGSHGGHNGLRSIIDSLETRDYFRIRFGIGRPSDKDSTISDYVLSPFSLEEEEKISTSLDEAVEIIYCCITEGTVKAMNKFNRKKQEPLSEKENEETAKIYPEN